jgi:hypothetical protein
VLEAGADAGVWVRRALKAGQVEKVTLGEREVTLKVGQGWTVLV